MSKFHVFYVLFLSILIYLADTYIVKPVYKDHSREPEDVAIMRCPLYTV
jgi:hypothetical protein